MTIEASLIFFLRNGDPADPYGLGRNAWWRDDNQDRRKGKLYSLATATVMYGFGRVFLAQPWGVKPGLPEQQGWVPEGQCLTLFHNDNERFHDLQDFCMWLRRQGVDVDVFEGVGRHSSILRKITFGLFGGWVWPNLRNQRDLDRFRYACEAAFHMGCNGMALDSLARCHNETGQGFNFIDVADRSGLRVLGEGYTDQAPWMSKINWTDHIDRSGYKIVPSKVSGVQHIAVISNISPITFGGSDYVGDGPDRFVRAVACAKRFEEMGWTPCYGADSADDIRQIREAIDAARRSR